MKNKINSENKVTNQLQFIKLLDEYEIDIFSINEIENRIDKKFININGIAENLTKKGLLTRIEKGKYCRHNFRNEWVIGNYLLNDGVIAYWSALNKHGLTEQFPNTIFIQTTKEKKEKNIFGIKYKFIKVAKRKHTGIEMQGYGNNQYRISCIEKTIADCFDLPEYSGGFAELIRAFKIANLDAKKMIKYCKAINNIAVIKRIAYIAELLNKSNFDIFLKFARQKVNNKYNLIDPIGLNNGEYINQWKIRLNVSKNDILEICNKAY